MGMLFLIILLLCLPSLTAAHPQQQQQQPSSPCGAGSPPRDFHHMTRKFRVQETTANRSSTWSKMRVSGSRMPVQINTYIHVLAADFTPNGGYASINTLAQQMTVLNANFALTGFSFVLRDVDYKVDGRWANLRGADDELYIKSVLRRGSYRDLNLYYFASTWKGNTGWCYYPAANARGRGGNTITKALLADGCTIHSGTLPGGSFAPWNEGKITTHEVGHWLGLMHTFENGCGDGDLVDDTPAQAEATSGCPVGRDSCFQPGLDPIHNFMDYSDNSCQYEFTPGQIARMQSVWDYYRA